MNQNQRKRVAVYLRVSTQDQSTELQRRDLLAYVEARGWQIHAIYEDKATGTNDARPELQRMLREARERRFDVVLVWKLDRLFRSLKGLVVTLQEFSELGIEFVSLRDNIDMSTSSGRLMTHMLAAFAEFERDLIVSRVRAGLASARAKGRRLGRPTTVDRERVHYLRSEGRSLGDIAALLGVSKSGVHKSLAKSTAKTAESIGPWRAKSVVHQTVILETPLYATMDKYVETESL